MKFTHTLTFFFSFLVACLNFTFPVTGTGAFSPLLSLPVGVAQMVRRLTVKPLGLKAFVTDPYIKMVPFISAVLHRCPLFTPDANISAIVMFSVLFLAKPIRPDRPGWDNNMYMGIISRRIIPILPPMDGGNRA